MVEEEGLSYYDFMAQMGVPYFHWGGLRSTDELLSMCGVDSMKNVLFVGCGSGYTACYAAKNLGCRAVGIDISEVMIGKARERAQEMSLTDRVEFKAGDAYELPFQDNRFDVVITEFVTMFLDPNPALREYVRVLKRGGFVGLNELYKSDQIPQEAAALVAEAEKRLQEAIRLPFVMPTPSDWMRWLREAGLEDIRLREVEYTYSYGEYAEALGGKIKLLKIMLRAIYHLLFNRRFRKRLLKVGKAKNVLMRNKETRKYVGAILCVGRKPA